MVAENEKTVKIQSNDGETFSIPVKVASVSEVIKNAMENEDDDDQENLEIPIPNVDAKVLQKVIDFCTHYTEEPMKEIKRPLKSVVLSEVVQQWYAEFVEVDQPLLYELLQAANFMNIKVLLDLCAAKIAIMIKGKTPDELRSVFNINREFTQEEKDEVRKEYNLWFFSEATVCYWEVSNV